jgi:hypothetical protein
MSGPAEHQPTASELQERAESAEAQLCAVHFEVGLVTDWLNEQIAGSDRRHDATSANAFRQALEKLTVAMSAQPRPADRAASKWPAYETPNLVALRAAAAKYWALYDKTDPTTAQPNSVVAKFLQDQYGVAKSLAESMATILRDPDLKNRV